MELKSGQKVEYIQPSKNGFEKVFHLSGEWTLQNIPKIEKNLKKIREIQHPSGKIILNISQINLIDTAGMLFFLRIRKSLRKGAGHPGNVAVQGIKDNDEFLKMFRLIKKHKKGEVLPKPKTSYSLIAFFSLIGWHSFKAVESMLFFLDFVGRTYTTFLRDLFHFSFRVREISNLVKETGITALPIIAITTFLIGVVIAFQSAFQLQRYGANIFIVDIVSISIARELSPILTSIVVAGRSGSAFTAQLGAMKITEELDAMSVMGFDIFRFLILPRYMALMIVLPLLIFFGDVVGIFGGMLVAKFQLGITFTSFIDRLHSSFAMRHFYAGLVKGPFFAATIAAIGCFRGLQVTRDTESIGRQTTISVVNSIFMVIIIDAVFSIIFTELGV